MAYPRCTSLTLHNILLCTFLLIVCTFAYLNGKLHALKLLFIFPTVFGLLSIWPLKSYYDPPRPYQSSMNEKADPSPLGHFRKQSAFAADKLLLWGGMQLPLSKSFTTINPHKDAVPPITISPPVPGRGNAASISINADKHRASPLLLPRTLPKGRNEDKEVAQVAEASVEFEGKRETVDSAVKHFYLGTDSGRKEMQKYKENSSVALIQPTPRNYLQSALNFSEKKKLFVLNKSNAHDAMNPNPYLSAKEPSYSKRFLNDSITNSRECKSQYEIEEDLKMKMKEIQNEIERSPITMALFGEHKYCSFRKDYEAYMKSHHKISQFEEKTSAYTERNLSRIDAWPPVDERSVARWRNQISESSVVHKRPKAQSIVDTMPTSSVFVAGHPSKVDLRKSDASDSLEAVEIAKQQPCLKKVADTPAFQTMFGRKGSPVRRKQQWSDSIGHAGMIEKVETQLPPRQLPAAQKVIPSYAEMSYRWTINLMLPSVPSCLYETQLGDKLIGGHKEAVDRNYGINGKEGIHLRNREDRGAFDTDLSPQSFAQPGAFRRTHSTRGDMRTFLEQPTVGTDKHFALLDWLSNENLHDEILEAYRKFGGDAQWMRRKVFALLDGIKMNVTPKVLEISELDRQLDTAFGKVGYKYVVEDPTNLDRLKNIQVVNVFDRMLPPSFNSIPEQQQLKRIFEHRQKLEYYIHPAGFNGGLDQREYVMNRIKVWISKGMERSYKWNYRTLPNYPTDSHIMECLLSCALRDALGDDILNHIDSIGRVASGRSKYSNNEYLMLRNVSNTYHTSKPPLHFEVQDNQMRLYQFPKGDSNIFEAFIVLLCFLKQLGSEWFLNSKLPAGFK